MAFLCLVVLGLLIAPGGTFYTPTGQGGMSLTEMLGPNKQVIYNPREGENVTISCDPVKVRSKVYSYEGYNKYWCRDPCNEWNTVLGSTNNVYKQVKITERADNRNGITIHLSGNWNQIMRSGKYWCCIDRAGRDYCSPVILAVQKAVEKKEEQNLSRRIELGPIIPRWIETSD